MLQPTSSDSKAGPPTLVNIALDLQITICTLLHPFDILALRKTCKTLELATRQRVVWVAALHQECVDNSLFTPSFPIENMSDVELEHAATGPRRWIELCAAFEQKHPNDSCANLRPRTTRIIEDSFAVTDRPDLFIVPGGRYMVSYSENGINVWDLGYTSSSDCKLIGSVGPEVGSWLCMVQATPDGKGLVIFSSHAYKHCSLFEIYPESETPQLTKIAYLDFDPTKDPPAYLSPDRLLWFAFYEDKIVFRVWDYRTNHSISFLAEIDMAKLEYNVEILATKTAIIALCESEILVWAIPLLSPQPPNFHDHDPTHIPPLLRIPFPDGIFSSANLVTWKSPSHWYFGSSQPLYFDILCSDSKLHRFEMIVKPDVSETSLHVISTEIVPHDFNNVTFQSYRICEGTLVTCWDSDEPREFGTYTGLTSFRFTTVISHGGPATKMLFPPITRGYKYNFFLCPASGRYVHVDDDIGKIVVFDLF